AGRGTRAVEGQVAGARRCRRALQPRPAVYPATALVAGARRVAGCGTTRAAVCRSAFGSGPCLPRLRRSGGRGGHAGRLGRLAIAASRAGVGARFHLVRAGTFGDRAESLGASAPARWAGSRSHAVSHHGAARCIVRTEQSDRSGATGTATVVVGLPR